MAFDETLDFTANEQPQPSPMPSEPGRTGRRWRWPGMSFEKFVEELGAAMQEASVIRLSPGPIDLKVGEDDRRAVLVLRQVLERSKADLTFGEAEGILIYNALKEMIRVAETVADAPASDPGAAGDTATDQHSGDPLAMADLLDMGNVSAYLTAWWWLVFWAARDREPELGRTWLSHLPIGVK